jgi:hypothetical protein
MSKSFRIRTEVGVDQQIQLELNQDFDYLEILSLKLRQSDVYDRNCSDYGVIAGRVIVNKGYGVPNARVSVFIPLSDIDSLNPLISTLYPYRDLSTKNEDGFRYNLLPYEPSYPGHAATGSFPSANDVLTRSEVIEVYDNYYKFTTKTNESGDFMIVGVPVGEVALNVDLDLSDMGCFSLSPSDLIRIGRASEGQFEGGRYKSSTDLESLPQIVNFVRSVNVSPFWGNNEICQIGIARADFDLRDLGITITPHSVFMGSTFSSSNTDYIKDQGSGNKPCKVKPKLGDLCASQTSPGRILSIRQTEGVDENGDPVLEQFNLENGGRVINEDGSWLVEVPMNLNFVTTNEFGEQVLSNDPTVGIPTEGKYRFKIEYDTNQKFSDVLQRADFLVPNIREYGWDSGGSQDPAFLNENTNQNILFQKSYSFSLSWGDYPDKDIAINCQDYFYNMVYNKVYTVSNLIDQYKSANVKDKFTGIKKILDRTCESEVNKFPTNDGHKDFDFLFFLLQILLGILSPIIWILIYIGHILFTIVASICFVICALKRVGDLINVNINCPGFCTGCGSEECSFESPIIISLPMLTYPDCTTCDCSAEDGAPQDQSPGDILEEYSELDSGNSILVDLNFPNTYGDQNEITQFIDDLINLDEIGCSTGSQLYDRGGGVLNNQEFHLIVNQPYIDTNTLGTIIKNLMAGDPITSKSARVPTPFNNKKEIGATIEFEDEEFLSDNDVLQNEINIVANTIVWTHSMTFAQKLNYFSNRSLYFHQDWNGINRVKIEVNKQEYPSNEPFYDYVVPILIEPNQEIIQGSLLVFQDPTQSNDPNLFATNFVPTIGSGVVKTINYANFNDQNNESLSANFNINIPNQTYTFEYPTDIEYFQVVKKFKVSELLQLNSTIGDDPVIENNFVNEFLLHQQLINLRIYKWYEENSSSIPGDNSAENEYYDIIDWLNDNKQCNCSVSKFLTPLKFIEDWENLEVAFLIRGVDPHTPAQEITYDLSRIIGKDGWGLEGAVVTGQFKLNIPIQATPSNDITFINQPPFGVAPIPGPTYSYTTATPHIFDQNFNLPLNNLFYNSFLRGYTPSGGKSGELPTQPYESFTSNLHQFYLDAGKNVSYELDYVSTTVDSSGLVYSGTILQPGHLGTGGYLYSQGPTTTPTNPDQFYYNYSFGFKPTTFLDNNFPINIEGNSFMSSTLINIPSYYANQGSIWDGNSNTCSLPNTKAPNPFLSRLLSYSYKQYGLPEITYSNSRGLVFRSDRLPISTTEQGSFSDGEGGMTTLIFNSNLPDSSSPISVYDNRFALHQNSNFYIANYGSVSEGTLTTEASILQGVYQVAGSTGVAGDSGAYEDFIEEMDEANDPAWSGMTNLIRSFQCEGMRELDCYYIDENGDIQISDEEDNPNGCNPDEVQNGCYRLFNRLLKIAEDIQDFNEWRQRFTISFALCRDVFSLDFINNWVNGTLFMPTFQMNTFYDSDNQPYYSYCKDLIAFNDQTNSFYYRSSPWVVQENQFGGSFVGKPGPEKGNGLYQGANIKQLGRPTTIMDLGPKDEFMKFVCFSDDFEGYNVNNLKTTTFQPIEDLLNFFVISRMINFNGWRALSNNQGLINQFFTRPDKRMDGDFTQLASFQSELGVKPFLGTNYNYNQIEFGVANAPESNNYQNYVFSVMFTGDTSVRKIVTPGVLPYINFGYPHTQHVPFYRWERKYGAPYNSTTWFGSEGNNWVTQTPFLANGYQNLDFTNATSDYFNQELGEGLFAIYDQNGNPRFDLGALQLISEPDNRNLIGAPFHFYFGTRVGNSALDLFIRKYGN